MKTSLQFALSSLIIAGLLPSLPAKIILGALVLLAALNYAVRFAPVGCESPGGFRSLTS